MTDRCSNTLLVLVGATGVGKTDLSIRLAQHYSCPIINADSRQIYRELPIGTAAPTEQEQACATHYFVGNKSITDSYNAGQYERDVLSLLDSLWSKHSVVIMTGGSMLYVDAVCYGLDAIPEVPTAIREQVKQQYEQYGLEWLQAQVQQLDPLYWQNADQANPQRLKHCLEVTLAAGRPYSSFRQMGVMGERDKQLTHRNFRIVKVGLERPREELYQRINTRVEQMLDLGLEAEARTVYPHKHLNSLQTVGYRELFAYFDGQTSREEAIRLIKQNSRHYAKRQLTWLRADTTIHWLDANMDYDKALDIIDGWLHADGLLQQNS